MAGWIKLYRDIVDDPLYFAEPFTRMQAWIDMLLLANYEDSVLYIRGNRVSVKRGQVSRSKEFLADRWHWSRGKVLRFLEILEKEHKIVQQKSHVITLISIINYSQYQEDGTTDSTTDSTTLKKNKNNISLSYTREEFLLNLDECYERLKNNTIWTETITMNTHAEYPQFGNEQFSIYLRKFFAKLANEGVTEKSPKDAMAHFANWLKKELSNEKNRTSHISKQEANAYAMQQFVNYCSTPDNSWTPGPDKPF